VKFGFIAKHRGIWPVEVLCEALGVSRSGFYAWRSRPVSLRARTDALLLVTVRSSFALSGRTYGRDACSGMFRTPATGAVDSAWPG
jgi:putative transposase